MPIPRVMAMIMAGGKGSRLFPLTRNQVKPAVGFGGKYRIIDFVLSNFVNSGIYSLYVLVQYRSLSLIEHLRTGWRTRGMVKDHFVTVVPPQMSGNANWYRGTADAVAQNLNLIRYYAPDIVAVFGADHVFRMDVRQMIDFHLENHADVTISAMPVLRSEASRFGVIECDLDGRVTKLVEKPAAPTPMPGEPDMAFASMGNFLFRPSYLTKLLEGVLEDPREIIDLSAHLLPGQEKSARVFAYNFERNAVSGADAQEVASYWRDIGTIPSYFGATMDLLGDPPRLKLDNARWPIRGARFDSAPTRIQNSTIENALICEGCEIRKATLRDCVIGRGVRIAPGAVIRNSVLMDLAQVGPGARIERAIIDSRVAIGDGDIISAQGVETGLETFLHPDSGVVVVPQPEPSESTQWFHDGVELEYF